MNDQRWGELADKIEPVWLPEREWAVRAAVLRRTHRQRTVARACLATATVGVVLVGTFVLTRERTKAPLAPPVATTITRVPSAPPGASQGPSVAGEPLVTPLSSETVLSPMPGHAGRGFTLRAGGARFSVPHDARHPFVVTAGGVTIEDLGTVFTVRYVGAERLRIAVEEGAVRVRAPGADTEVAAGSTLEVPLSAPAEAPAWRAPHAASGVSSAWRPLAERGQYEEAQRALRKAGPSAVRDETTDLLLAADAARLSGHPAEAVPYLERVLRGHARDPRAGLAAFTLGRVLLDELGRPREAVDAFTFARSSGGPLAEDALAREVEAASRAGDSAHSRELAQRYLTLYPNGRRTKAVSRFGGLD